MEVIPPLLALSEPLVLGLLGAALTLAGSILRSALNATPRKIGACFCAFGLMLMVAGFICITSNASLLAYAQKV